MCKKPEAYMIESVEVLRGPVATLFGNSSVGSAVNTTSKAAGMGRYNQYQLQFGTDHGFQAGVDFSGALDEAGELEYRIADGSLDNTTDNAFSIAPSLVWTPNTQTNVTLLANYQDTEAFPITQFASAYGMLLEMPDTFLTEDCLPEGFKTGEPSDVLDVTQKSVMDLSRFRAASLIAFLARSTMNKPIEDLTIETYMSL